MRGGGIPRFLRTLGRMAAPQVAHRLRLRVRSRMRLAFPDLAERRAVGLAGPTPAERAGGTVPLDLLRPCARDLVAKRAREVSGGSFTFLNATRQLGSRPFPPPANAPLLWSYQLEYMDYLLDLAVVGDWETVERLVRARLGVDGDPGVAGAHPYTEARRASAWLSVLPLAPHALRRTLAAGAWRAVCRVARNLELDVGGNHLLENGLALVLGGARFLGRRAAALRGMGRKILFEGVRDQVLEDGAHYELSPTYHARVLGLLVEGALALRGGGEVVPSWYWEKIGTMAAFLSGILDSSGRLPLLGDSVRDPFLSPGLLVDAVLERLPAAPAPIPSGDRFYPDAGLVLFEDPDRENLLTLDAGPTCPPRLPAHGQADTFSLILALGGVEFLTDAGLYEYAAGEMRDWCRSTRAHSTVEVDGENSSEVWASFRVGRGARIADRYWACTDGLASSFARHDGYRHLGVVHGRYIAHLAPGRFVVCDSLESRRTHRYVSRLHLAPGCDAERAGERRVRVRRDGRELHVLAFGRGRLGWEDGWHCPSFGVRRRSRLLTLSCEGQRERFGFVLSEQPVDDAGLEAGGVVCIETDGGRVTRSVS